MRMKRIKILECKKGGCIYKICPLNSAKENPTHNKHLSIVTPITSGDETITWINNLMYRIPFKKKYRFSSLKGKQFQVVIWIDNNLWKTWKFVFLYFLSRNWIFSFFFLQHSSEQSHVFACETRENFNFYLKRTNRL